MQTREPMTIETLIQILERTPQGTLGNVRDEVVPLLVEGWHEFKGSGQTSMEAWKLKRAEDFQWDPPVLSFTMERHGATMLGSTRAELQRWELNLKTRAADCSSWGYRQLKPTSPRVNIKSIASSVCEVILKGRNSNNDLVQRGVIVWKGDEEVWIYHGKLISGGYQQTVASRRRRFRDELTNMLKPAGWKFATIRIAMIFTKAN
jgi:hypothetical protein